MWGDATVRAGALIQTGPLAFGNLKRNVGLAGVTIRPWQKLSLNVDYEGATTDQNFFRTSLYNYHQVRARARYQAFVVALVPGEFPRCSTTRIPRPASTTICAAATIRWPSTGRPNGGKRVSVMAEYDRYTMYSSIDYLLLPFFTPDGSDLPDNAHTASSDRRYRAAGDRGGARAKLTAGGSLFISAGSRSTRYYQPLGRLSVPLRKHVQWNTEWRWYGFGEPFYLYEGFRTHMFMTGLRVSK